MFVMQHGPPECPNVLLGVGVRFSKGTAGTDVQPGTVAALHQRMQLQLLEAAVWDAEPAQAAMPLWTRASAVAIAALLLFAMAATGPRTTRGSAGNTWASGPLPASCRC